MQSCRHILHIDAAGASDSTHGHGLAVAGSKRGPGRLDPGDSFGYCWTKALHSSGIYRGYPTSQCLEDDRRFVPRTVNAHAKISRSSAWGYFVYCMYTMHLSSNMPQPYHLKTGKAKNCKSWVSIHQKKHPKLSFGAKPFHFNPKHHGKKTGIVSRLEERGAEQKWRWKE